MRKCIALVVLLVISFCWSQSIETLIPLPDSMGGLFAPYHLLYHSTDNTMYAGDYSWPRMVVFDCATAERIAVVDLPRVPRAMCSRPGSNRIYLCQAWTEPDSVSVLDTETRQVVRSLPVGENAFGICYNPTADKAYSFSYTDGWLCAIDCSGDSVLGFVEVGERAQGVCCYAPENKVYSMSARPESLVVVNCTTDSVVARVHIGTGRDYPMVADTLNGRLYVLADGQGELVAVDAAHDTVLARVSMPGKPDTMCLNTWDNKVYVTIPDSNRVVVVCGQGDSLLATIQLDELPRSIAWVPTDNTVYCGLANGLAVIDCSADTLLSRLPWGRRVQDLCWAPNENHLYSANFDSRDVWVLDCATRDTVASALLYFTPSAACAVPDQSKVYCSGSTERRIAVIDCYQNLVVDILHVPGVPRVLYYSPMAGRLYCGLDGDDGPQLAIFDVSADTIVRMLSMPFIPQRWCENTVNRKLYTAAASDLDTVVTLSADGDSILGRFSVLPGVGALVYNPARNRVYCASCSENKVAVLDGSVDTLVATVNVPDEPQDLCYAPLRDFVCCACRGGNCVAVINCASNGIYRLALVGQEPVGLVYNPTGQKLYTADYGDDSVSVIDGRTMLELMRVKACDAPEYLTIDSAGNKIYCAGWNKPGLVVIDGDNDSLIRQFELDERVCRMTWSERFRRLYVCHIHQYTEPFLTVIEDTLVGGIQGSSGRQRAAGRVGPTVVRNVLFLRSAAAGPGLAAELLDITGRKVMELRPGLNDIRHLAPGVYFLNAQAENGRMTGVGRTFRRVVIVR